MAKYRYYVVVETQTEKFAVYSELNENITIEEFKLYQEALKKQLKVNSVIITNLIRLDKVK